MRIDHGLTRLLTIGIATCVLLFTCSTASPSEPKAPADRASSSNDPGAPFDLGEARVEVDTRYAHAHPETRSYVLWTAETFGRSGLWLNENAFAALNESEQEALVVSLAKLLEEGEYGRHLCRGLAQAGALKDERLLPGLMKVAGYHQKGRDYDCRAKWMAAAALARQESPEAVPLLISLVDHGNQNTRMWSRAALSRMTGQDFRDDKHGWAQWWQSQGHDPIEPKWLEPWQPPATQGHPKPK